MNLCVKDIRAPLVFGFTMNLAWEVVKNKIKKELNKQIRV